MRNWILALSLFAFVACESPAVTPDVTPRTVDVAPVPVDSVPSDSVPASEDAVDARVPEPAAVVEGLFINGERVDAIRRDLGGMAADALTPASGDLHVRVTELEDGASDLIFQIRKDGPLPASVSRFGSDCVEISRANIPGESGTDAEGFRTKVRSVRTRQIHVRTPDDVEFVVDLVKSCEPEFPVKVFVSYRDPEGERAYAEVPVQ